MRPALPHGSYEFAIASEPARVPAVLDQIEHYLVTHLYERGEIFGIRLSLEEAIVNAIRHGNRLDEKKKVRVRIDVSPHRFDATILDEGPGFNAAAVPDCCREENLERPGGRGLKIMRHYMTEVRYEPPGNRLFMSKVRYARLDAL